MVTRDSFNQWDNQLHQSLVDEIERLIPPGEYIIFPQDKQPLALNYERAKAWGQNDAIFMERLVEISHDVELAFYTVCGEDKTKCGACSFLSNQLMDFIEAIRDVLRDRKMVILRKLVAEAGGTVMCDGTFTFHSHQDTEGTANVSILQIDLGATTKDRLYFDCCYRTKKPGAGRVEQEEDIPFEVLDNLVEYVREQANKNLNIHVTDEQCVAISHFKQVLEELDNAGVGIISDQDRNILQFFNKTHVGSIETVFMQGGKYKPLNGFKMVQNQLDEQPSVELFHFYHSQGGEAISMCKSN